jgi:hypothetical protein
MSRKYIPVWNKAYREKNKEKISEYRKKRRMANPEKSREECRKYYNSNKDKFLERRRNRLKTDIGFKMRTNLCRRINHSIKKGFKSKSTLELLGCSIDCLKNHLEAQFKEGMSWDNYGHKGWHIDHIRPCASFDLTDPEQQKECFHYSNLQPLWHQDNFSKSDSWIK